MSEYQKDGCLTCGTFPYIDSLGMCGTFTFGEAGAQQELISGKIEGAVWQRRQTSKNKRKKKTNQRSEIMKLKNVKVGDLVEAKIDIVKRRFASESLIVNSGIICKVISKECADYAGGLSVCIEAEGVKIWCNHNDLRKHSPKTKTLDQSVFNDLDKKWRWLGVNSDGTLLKATYKPKISVSGTRFILLIGSSEVFGENYDTTDWQNSLIERDKVELTGNALCKAMLDRGDKIVLCAVSDASEEDALLSSGYDAISRALNNGMFDSTCSAWHYVVPINNQCRPLTASEVGL